MTTENYDSGKAVPARFSKRGRSLQIACVKYLYPESVEDRAALLSYGLVYLLNRKEGLQTTTRELLPVLKPLLTERETLDPALPEEQQKMRLLLFIGEGPLESTRPGGCIEDCFTSKLGNSERIYHASDCPLYRELDDVKIWTESLPGLIKIINPTQQTLPARLLSKEKLSSFFLKPGVLEYSLPMWAQLGLPGQSEYILKHTEEEDQPIYRIQFREDRKHGL